VTYSKMPREEKPPIEKAKAAGRSATVQALTDNPLDVLIVGGGIVGAGIARDAAMRGLRIGLVEQHDFAFGTSSRSTRLLHGGLRYLAQGRIGLVHEASVEKRIVHTIAPHLSAPLPFVFPTYQCPPWGTWALWKLRIGVKLYDLLCGGRNLGRSSSLAAEQLRKRFPGIRPQRLTGAVRYYDGLTQDARLVIDTLRAAANAGGLLLNYCRLERAGRDQNTWRCVLKDRLTDESYEVTSRCLVNATGVWAEQIEHSSVRLRPTKGVHLVVDHSRMPISDAIVMTEGNRILFAIPWGERVILGTTDTDYQGSFDHVLTDPQDVDYILEVINEFFPEAKLSADDVISEWAGLRPLIADSRGRPSDISRSHEIRSSQPGWWDVAGGKLTTYRLMGEQTVNRIERFLKRRITPCRTAVCPLLEPQEVEGFSSLIPPEATQRAVDHYCRNEWAIHLEDVMLRRGGWHYYDPDASRIASSVARWMGEQLGWDQKRQEQERSRYRAAVDAPQRHQPPDADSATGRDE